MRAPALLARVYAIIVPAHRDRRAGLGEDLRRLGELARRIDIAEPVSSPSTPH